MAKNLDVRLALMYSFPQSANQPYDLQLFMVDVETGELFVSERVLGGSDIGGAITERVDDMANNIIHDYLEDLAAQPTEDLATQPIRVAILPAMGI